MIDKLTWDSEFFGYNVGLYNLENDRFDNKLFHENKENFELIYIFSESEIELELENKIKLVDVKTLFEKKVSNNLIDNETIISFDSSIHNYSELEQLAYLSGTFSRFKIDTNFKNNEYYKLYKIWLDKSIEYSIALKVFVKIIDNKIAGFVTLKKNNEKTSQIGLIAVSDAFQGRGIASELIKKAEFESFINGFEYFQVPTQFENKPALKLYEKNGFEIINKVFIYHYWKK
jgi:dTDP-4-amino-4,6-dideoxy-D-galactose acyltransferase